MQLQGKKKVGINEYQEITRILLCFMLTLYMTNTAYATLIQRQTAVLNVTVVTRISLLNLIATGVQYVGIQHPEPFLKG